MEAIIPCKEKYPAPECEVQEMVPEGAFATSGGLLDDKYEFLDW